MKSDMIWKELTDIDIVYSDVPGDRIEVDGVSYPKAYVVSHGDEKMMESALSWAHFRSPSNPKVVTTKNDGFTFRIARSASSSYRSGKLSFWMCILEKDGIEPFATGINSDLLYLLIMQSTLTNGALLEDKVFFARCNGQLGVLHSQMDAYCEYQRVQSLRESVAKNKTTRWEPGNVYATVTRRDVMMGDLVMPLCRRDVRFGEACYDPYDPWAPTPRTFVYALDFDAKPMKIFAPEQTLDSARICGARIGSGNGPNQLDDFEMCLAYGLRDPHESCPSRHCEGPAPFAADDHGAKVRGALEKICALVRDELSAKDQYQPDDWVDWVDLAAYHLMLCELSPRIGLDALGTLRGAMQTATKGKTQANFTYELVYGSTTEKLATHISMIDRIIELAQAHYGHKPASLQF